jgi:hypothetical protein
VGFFGLPPVKDPEVSWAVEKFLSAHGVPRVLRVALQQSDPALWQWRKESEVREGLCPTACDSKSN